MKTHLKPELLSSGLPHSGCLKACPTPGSALMTSVKIRATALMLSPCTQVAAEEELRFQLRTALLTPPTWAPDVLEGMG